MGERIPSEAHPSDKSNSFQVEIIPINGETPGIVYCDLCGNGCPFKKPFREREMCDLIITDDPGDHFCGKTFNEDPSTNDPDDGD